MEDKREGKANMQQRSREGGLIIPAGRLRVVMGKENTSAPEFLNESRLFDLLVENNGF
jgi:hypothetical protein